MCHINDPIFDVLTIPESKAQMSYRFHLPCCAELDSTSVNEVLRLLDLTVPSRVWMFFPGVLRILDIAESGHDVTYGYACSGWALPGELFAGFKILATRRNATPYYLLLPKLVKYLTWVLR